MTNINQVDLNKNPLDFSRYNVFYQIRKLVARYRNDIPLVLGVTCFIWGWMLIYMLLQYQPNFVSKGMVIIKDSAITRRYVDTDQKDSAALQTTSSNASNPVLNTMGLLKSAAINDALYHYFVKTRPTELKKRQIRTRQDWEAFYGDGTGILKSKHLPGTDLIALQFSWSNPQVSKEALQVIVTAFQQASLNLNRGEQAIRSHYLKQQVDKINRELEAVRRQKSLFKSTMKTLSIEQEKNDLAHTRIELETQLNHVLAQAHGRQIEGARYQQMLGMSPGEALRASAVGQNITMGKLQDDRYALAQEYAHLKATLTDKHPKVKEVHARLIQLDQNIQQELGRTLRRGPSPLMAIADSTRGSVANQLATANAEASNLRSMAAVLRNRLSQVNRQMLTMPGVEEKLATIEQQERILSNALDMLEQKKLEAELKEAETLSNVFIVDMPRLPLHEKFPTRTHLLFVGFLLGLAGGVTAYFVKHHRLSRRFTQMMSKDTLGRDRVHSSESRFSETECLIS